MHEITDAAPGERAQLAEGLGPLLRRFSHTDAAGAVLQHRAEALQIVTGFGPTNAPTAGTLSVMLGIVELQQQLDVPVTVVISELGAWNSRNVPWHHLTATRDQMLAFLRSVGFDEYQGVLRSHLDPANLVRAGRLARFLHRQDFLDHREDLHELYAESGLLGTEVGVTVDTLYTVADILEPFDHGATSVLMVSGQEEAYFTQLARLVLHRQASAGPLTLGWHGHIGALYFRVLEGLAGYPKMSKSIPASSIHLGMTHQELETAILSDDETSQPALLSAIELSSGWDTEQLRHTRDAYAARTDAPQDWLAIKADYLATFAEFARQWRRCEP